MIVIAASFALALVAAPQQACASHDTDCRIRQLEQRVQALEGRLAGQTSSAAVGMDVTLWCSGSGRCLQQARAECERAGFPRGVPASSQNAPSGSGTVVTRVTCVG